MSRKLHQSGRIPSFVSFGLLIIWLIGLGLAATHWRDIQDWQRLQGYDVPSAVADLVSQDTMTDYGRKIFYVNHPLLDDKATFGDKCPNNGGEQTIVLGCYLGHQSGIFLLSVNDPRLDGVTQVTAAHEMLHGAYERLSDSERQHVDSLLMDYYNNDLKDQRILDTIDAYKQSEPKDVVNEMHSIFGTEIASLPVPLEQYYKHYFTDRSQVAAFAARYQAAFTSRKTAISQYDNQLTSLKDQISNTEADMKSKRSSIDAQQSTLNSLRSSNNIAAYNAGIPSYNSLVDSYNRQVASLKSQIAQYNQIVAERNAVALEQDALTKELSSDATPISR